jgi:hypothetical protein
MPIISIRVSEATRTAIRYIYNAGQLSDATSLNDYLVQLIEAAIDHNRTCLPPDLKLKLTCTIRTPRPGRLRRAPRRKHPNKR